MPNSDACQRLVRLATMPGECLQCWDLQRGATNALCPFGTRDLVEVCLFCGQPWQAGHYGTCVHCGGSEHEKRWCNRE